MCDRLSNPTIFEIKREKLYIHLHMYICNGVAHLRVIAINLEVESHTLFFAKDKIFDTHLI